MTLVKMVIKFILVLALSFVFLCCEEDAWMEKEVVHDETQETVIDSGPFTGPDLPNPTTGPNFTLP